MITLKPQLHLCSNTQLLNQVIQNVFPEFDGTVKNRNTYIDAEGRLLRWVDVPLQPPVLEIIRQCTAEEVEVWLAYKQLIKSLSEVKSRV